MKKEKVILDVDFIGGEGSLTSVEEQAISEYFKNRKSISSQTRIPSIQKIRSKEKEKTM